MCDVCLAKGSGGGKMEKVRPGGLHVHPEQEGARGVRVYGLAIKPCA